MTIGFTLLPAAFATVPPLIAKKGYKAVGKTFFEHLPFVNLVHHYTQIRDIYDKQYEIAQLKSIVELETCNTSAQDERKRAEEDIEDLINEINEIKSTLQSFKIWAAMLESTPQFILQLSNAMRQHPDKWYMDFFGNTTRGFQVTTSLMSVVFAVSGLITQMPFLVGKTMKTPLLSKWLTYVKTPPLVFMAVTPRLLTLSVIASTFTAKVNELGQLFYYGGFSFTCFVVHCLGTFKILNHQRNKIAEHDKATMKALDEHFILAMIPSIMSPYGLCVLGSNYLISNAILTSVWQSLALGVTWAVAETKPELLVNATMGHDDDFIEDEEDFIELMSMILIPLLLLSTLGFWIIQKMVHLQNDKLVILSAIDNNDQDLFEEELHMNKYGFYSQVPGDLYKRTIFHYVCSENPKFAQIMVENLGAFVSSNDLDYQDSLGRSPLMIASEMGHVELVKYLLQQNVNPNLVTYEGGNSAWHLVCSSQEGDLEAKKAILEEMWTQAERLNIDIQMRNAENLTAMDLLLQNPKLRDLHSEMTDDS